jgi:hypothetical protein
VPSRRAVPDTALVAIRRFCDQRVPSQLRDEIRVECDVRGQSVTISERRPPWRPDQGPTWSRQPVAQLRYDSDDDRWGLYYADRNGRWHHYEMREPSTQVEELLAEIDADPTGIFWG